MSFFTANGVTSTNDVAKIHFDEFESTHSPDVLDESPSVLSVGKKCIEEGYSFVWPANGMPYMISPDNKKIMLEVEGNIPYVVKDSDFCSPMVDEQTESISKMITGHIDVGYQPEIIDHEVDPQGFNCDMDDQPCIPQRKKRRRRKKRAPMVPGEEEKVGEEDPEAKEEAVDEDDADDLEVDVVDGASRMVRRGALKSRGKDHRTSPHTPIQESLL